MPLIACIKAKSPPGPPLPPPSPPPPGPSPLKPFPASVPGDLLAAQERADLLGLNGSPMYRGLNLMRSGVRRAQNASYWLNKTVLLPPGFSARATHQLIVRGLDYNASFFLNGKPVGSHAGPYLTGRIDLDLRSLLGPAATAHEGPRLDIAVLFHFPPAGILSPWMGPGNAAQGVMWDYLSRWKSMTGIGYDFAQNIWPIGVLEGISIIGTDHVVMKDLVVLPSVPHPYTVATLNVSFTAVSHVRQTATVTWAVTEVDTAAHSDDGVVASATTSVALEVGANPINVGDVLKLHSPKLWFPRGSGAQPLYRLNVAVTATSSGGAVLAQDNLTKTFGVRDLQHVRNPGPSTWTYIEGKCSTAPTTYTLALLQLARASIAFMCPAVVPTAAATVSRFPSLFASVTMLACLRAVRPCYQSLRAAQKTIQAIAPSQKGQGCRRTRSRRTGTGPFRSTASGSLPMVLTGSRATCGRPSAPTSTTST